MTRCIFLVFNAHMTLSTCAFLWLSRPTQILYAWFPYIHGPKYLHTMYDNYEEFHSRKHMSQHWCSLRRVRHSNWVENWKCVFWLLFVQEWSNNTKQYRTLLINSDEYYIDEDLKQHTAFLPTEDTKNKIEHEEWADDDEWNKVDPRKCTSHCVVSLEVQRKTAIVTNTAVRETIIRRPTAIQYSIAKSTDSSAFTKF